ncbi:MAG: MerR family transcriptional regulator [Clostridia bacterium]|nr:MerR family transcriptional regulator [Clostridia bacterium]
MAYNLNQVAMISGLTTRTLRSYLKMGILQGEKIDGNWCFTEEDLSAFLDRPAVRQASSAKRNALIYDFLGDTYKKANRICTILDFPVSAEEAKDISSFFCEEITKRGQDIEFRFFSAGQLWRVILSGAEDAVTDILSAYYRQ